jgi:hypothetical protein
VRSMKALQFLREQGFKYLKNVKGGIHAWSDEIDQNVPKYWSHHPRFIMLLDEEIFSGDRPEVYQLKTKAAGPAGELPLTPELLLERPVAISSGSPKMLAWAGIPGNWAGRNISF